MEIFLGLSLTRAYLLQPTKAIRSCVAVALVTACTVACSPCENNILAEYPSPEGSMKVVVFGRACGAATGFSTQASLVPTSSIRVLDGGNLFIADTDHGAAPSSVAGGPELRVRWLASDTVELAHHAKVRRFKAEERFDQIRIQYATFE